MTAAARTPRHAMPDDPAAPLRDRLREPLDALRQRAELASVLGGGLEPHLAAETVRLIQRDAARILHLVATCGSRSRQRLTRTTVDRDAPASA